MGKANRWLIVGFVLSLSLAGCVTLGISGEPAGTEVPLVPLPPFPSGRAEAKVQPTSDEAPSKSKKDEAPRSKSQPKVNTSSEEPAKAPTARKLLDVAQERIKTLDSYIVRLTRREQVGDKPVDPEQTILFKFRKQPWSVHLKWLSKEGLGREVVYVRGQHQGKLHTKLAAGDMPFMPAGKRLSLMPDNPLVRSSTRHPITEAGIAASVERLAALVEAIDKGDRKRGALTVLESVERTEFSKPVAAIEHEVPVGFDSSLPKGGTRTYFFHPDNGLPMLIRTLDESGKEVEYYRYDRLQAEVQLDDADFDPKVLYGDK
jgi:hypothetical protein